MQNMERFTGTYTALCTPFDKKGALNEAMLERLVAYHVAAGVDGIEISSTLSGDHAQPAAEGIDSEDKEAYFAPLARAVKAAVQIPVILVGGLRSLGVMERQVADGSCDLVSLCRPFIREPDLVNAFAEGRTARAACISCNKCYDPHGFRCVFV